MPIDVPAITSRAEAEAFLDARIGQGVKPGLERISGLMAFAGDPQTTYPSIHIAGTNGKTTTTRMVQQILGAHGLATGGFTSPHLDRIEERFSLHGAPIDAERFVQAVRDIAWFVVGFEDRSGDPVTYFEVTASLAFTLFAEAAVDVAVVEVGLGGRLDATNIVDAAVSVITGIDIDHTEYLGPTIADIAGEKAAILKADGTLVTGPLPADALGPVERAVEATGANWVRTNADFSVDEALVSVGGWQCEIEGVFTRYTDLYLPVHGRHQVDHLATAIATCEMFLGRALDADALATAAASMSSPGRLEVVARRPVVIIDGAHNHQGFVGLADTLDAEFPPLQWQLVLGVRGERSVSELVEPLVGRIAAIHAAAAKDGTAIPASSVAQLAGAALGRPASHHASVAEALTAAIAEAGEEGGVVVAGSLYVAGEARQRYPAARDRSADVHLRIEAEVDVADTIEGEEDLPVG